MRSFPAYLLFLSALLSAGIVLQIGLWVVTGCPLGLMGGGGCWESAPMWVTGRVVFGPLGWGLWRASAHVARPDRPPTTGPD